MTADLGWEFMDHGQRVRIFWSAFNHSYGTWYELRCERAGMSSELRLASGKVATALVQPDMEPGRWYWSIRVGQTRKSRERPVWGSARAAEEAMEAVRVELQKRL